MAGMKVRWFAPLVVVGIAGILYLATHIDERRARLLAFLNPEQYEASGGYQQLQGLIAIGSGGVGWTGPRRGPAEDALPALCPYGLYFSDDRRGIGFAGHAWLIVFSYLVVCVCGTLILP